MAKIGATTHKKKKRHPGKSNAQGGVYDPNTNSCSYQNGGQVIKAPPGAPPCPKFAANNSKQIGGKMSRAVGSPTDQEMQRLTSQLSTAEFQYNTAPNGALAVEISTLKDKIAALEGKSNVRGLTDTTGSSTDDITALQGTLAGLNSDLSTAMSNLSNDQGKLTSLNQSINASKNDPTYLYDLERLGAIAGVPAPKSGIKWYDYFIPFVGPALVLSQEMKNVLGGNVSRDKNGNAPWIDSTATFNNGVWNGAGLWFGSDSEQEFSNAVGYVNGQIAGIQQLVGQANGLSAQIGTPTDTGNTDYGIINGLNTQITAVTDQLNSAEAGQAAATKTVLEGQGQSVLQQEQGAAQETSAQAQVDAATGQTTSNTTLYITIGVVVLVVAGLYFFSKSHKAA